MQNRMAQAITHYRPKTPQAAPAGKTLSGITGLYAAANGFYAQNGLYGGRPYYTKGLYNLYYSPTVFSGWMVSTILDRDVPPPFMTQLFGKSSTAAEPPASGYMNFTAAGTLSVT